MHDLEIATRRSAAADGLDLEAAFGEQPRPRRGYHGDVRHPIALACLLGLAGCTNEDSGGTPTFANDIAAIVYQSCTPCHRPGEPTPFSLLGYDDVYKRRDQIVEVTQERLMPPWLPTRGDFVGDRRLRDEQIDLLERWVEAGAPRGDAASEPACPEFASGWQLREPDLVLEVDDAVAVAASGPDRFRSLVLPVPIDRVRFVEAVEIQPRNAAVHHAVLAVDATREARRLDGLDPAPGFDGMVTGNAGPPDGQFLGWTPGKQVRKSRDGMAWRLFPGHDLVLQLHLTPTGRPELVKPRIGLYFTDQAPDVVSFPLVMFWDRIDIAPGESDYVLRDHIVLPVPVTLHSIYPHAHYLCREMKATVTPPGGSSYELFCIDSWDFDWQDDYEFASPIELAAGTRIAMEYRYDNSAANPQNPNRPPRRVRFGLQSTDEMGTLTLQLTVADLAARRQLAEASVRRDLEKIGGDVKLELELVGLLREQGRTDEAMQVLESVRRRHPENADAWRELGLCLSALNRNDEAERAFRECLSRDATQIVALGGLGFLLARSGQTRPAMQLFERALALSPNNARLHNNLATACFSEGDLDRAERHYLRAVALDDRHFGAWFNLGRVLASKRQKDRAREALERARALRPGHAGVEEALLSLERQ